MHVMRTGLGLGVRGRVLHHLLGDTGWCVFFGWEVGHLWIDVEVGYSWWGPKSIYFWIEPMKDKFEKI